MAKQKHQKGMLIVVFYSLLNSSVFLHDYTPIFSIVMKLCFTLWENSQIGRKLFICFKLSFSLYVDRKHSLDFRVLFHFPFSF